MIGTTLFSGIGAPETAMPSWSWPWHAEIEKFPSAVLEARHPGSINLGDVSSNDFADRAAEIAQPDVLVFGSPCQSFSVAGKRLGLDDPRGNLALVSVGLAGRLRTRWFVFENVPGLLSSDEGRDFGALLGILGELGYGFAYRVLDAQFFGVPQRRRRVFVVGYLGDWRRAAAVLFEPNSMRGDPAPRREAWQRPAPTIASRPTGGGGLGTDFDCDGGLIASTGDIAHCLNAGGMGRQDYETETMVFGAQMSTPHWQHDIADTLQAKNPKAVAFSVKDYGADAAEDLAPTLRAGGHTTSHANAGVMPAIAFAQNQLGEIRASECVGTLNTNSNASGRSTAMANVGSAVRRLTPRECERLQGFPDDYTLIDYRRKPAADGPRYKALGNSMAVPVMRWILTRIEQADSSTFTEGILAGMEPT
jgi:DNA (cytosine-5)-methyltransferase 1